ncbi:hypothetical protein BDB00DRAFT_792669 [Zychaea mexicana]|uniref:uncharacterized protein n=1 Tax=Zychaea mexicana TaxID=64656 RepID=UPI0022FE5AA4|nr:uncharacterized protein BDB00DRAFT_792669 [Zychaea mexicana]KAI9484704.1 hypothetical protein BDB00DRAFT_792669 [Zychaea mexicana]
MAHLASVQLQYQKALRFYLLTKYTTAATACVKAIIRLPKQSNGTEQEDVNINELEALRYSIWTLYLNIATTLLTLQDNKLTPHVTKLFGLSPAAAKSHDQFVHEMWQLLTEGYGGPGNVDPRLISSCLVMTLKLQAVNVGRQIVEQWYATMSDATMDYISSIAAQEGSEPSDDVYYNGCMEAIELYVTRILPAMNDYETALSFVQYNPLLSEEKKEALQGYVRENEQKASRERQKKVEQQKNAERLAKLAEERERARLQEERERAEKEMEAAKAHEIQANGIGHSHSEHKQEQLDTLSSSSSSSSSLSTSGPLASATNGSAVSNNERQLSRNSATTNSRRAFSLEQRSPAALKEWVRQLFAAGSATSVATLLMILALIGLLRGFRGRWSEPLKIALAKLWQTVQMGTKVTYL